MVDIGEIVFVDLLRMTEYPGSPFSGNIVNDLIMFLLVPTVFIILVIYMMLGRVVHTAHVRLRLLLGITTYLFIIAGGFYKTFAFLAGPYFIFLIFVLGILFFFLGHFRTGAGGGAGAAAGGGGGFPAAYGRGLSDEEEIRAFLRAPHLPGPKKHILEQRYKALNRNIRALQKVAEHGGRAEGLDNMMMLRDEIELKLYGEIRSESFRDTHS